MALLKLGELMRFVSRSVITGFVNALAILIFMAQLPELMHVTWHVYAITAAGLAIHLSATHRDPGGAVTPGGDCGADGGVDELGAACPHGGRHGAVAGQPAELSRGDDHGVHRDVPLAFVS